MTANATPSRPKTIWLLVTMPVTLILTHYAAVLPHESAHSTMAWLLGVKNTPGDLSWGPATIGNLLLFYDIDENVDYSAIPADAQWKLAVIAFAGPGIANGGMYLISRWLITKPFFAVRPYHAFVLFWWYVMQAANLWCYVPIRVFADDGDIHHIEQATGISPWWIYVLGGWVVVFVLCDMYRTVLPWVLKTCEFTASYERAIMLIATTGVTFGYFGIPAILEPDAVSFFQGITSEMAIPVIVLMMWRSIVLTGTRETQVDPYRPAKHTALAR